MTFVPEYKPYPLRVQVSPFKGPDVTLKEVKKAFDRPSPKFLVSDGFVPEPHAETLFYVSKEGMTFKFYKKDSKILEQYGIDLDTIEWWG